MCFTQFRSLPLRDSWVSWSQGLALSIDVLVILILLWRPIAQRDARVSTERPAHGRVRSVLSLRTVVVIACLSAWTLSVQAWQVEFRDDTPSSWWHRTTLDLQAKDLTGGNLAPGTINRLMDDDVQKRADELASIAQSHLLQGRDLRGANFYTAVLPKLDLRTFKHKHGKIDHTHLSGASLSWAQMQGALLNDTDLARANLKGTRLQGAEMVKAKLPRAHLDDAQLQQADLSEALLNEARLLRAQLQGAALVKTKLVRAVLAKANLQAANLRGAQLQGADLSGALLEGADLSGANLSQAILRGAKLDGSRLCGAVIDNTDFDGTGMSAGVDRPPVGLTRPCGRSREDSVLAEHLMELACSDAYAARGLSQQALGAEDPELSDFAGALVAKNSDLLKRASDKDCPGVRLLPAGTLEGLRNLRKHAAQDAVTPDGAVPP
jgi:uncharacterized protein YjbI with pentapeptide repeats